MFSPLRQPAFFRNFTVEPGEYAIVWNEEIDISEYEIWQHGVTLEDADTGDDLIGQSLKVGHISRSESRIL